MTAFLLRRPYVYPPFQSTFCFVILRIKYQHMTSDKMIFGALLSDYFSRERQWLSDAKYKHQLKREPSHYAGISGPLEREI